MNKLLLLSLLGFILIIQVTGSQDEEKSIQNVEEELLIRHVREADPKKRSKQEKKKRKQQRRKKNKNKNKKNKNRKINKKNKNKKKKNKKKNANKKRNKASRKKNQQRATESCHNTTCLDTAVSLLKLRKDKVTNYLVQEKRINAKVKIAGKKKGKGSGFGPSIQALIAQGGGNVSALSCGKNTTNAGALQMKNLTTVLSSCNADIIAVCNSSALPLPNATELTACKTAMDNFHNHITNCSTLTGAASCACWANNTVIAEDIKVIKACDLSKTDKAIKTAVSQCKSAFGKCRKYEDDVGNIIQACSQDSGALKSKLKNLSANKDAVTSVLTKVKSLTSSRKRAEQTCASFTVTVGEIVTLTAQSPTSYTILTKANSIVNVTVTCSATEITALSATESQLSASISALDTALTSAIAQYTDLTGESVSATDIASFTACTTAAACSGTTTTTSSTVVTTASSSGRRDLLVQKMLARKRMIQ